VKSLTREQLQPRKNQAVRIVRDVVGDPEGAAEVADEDLEDYAIPVRFSDEEKMVWLGRTPPHDIDPMLGSWRRTRKRPLGAFENAVEDQHRHVAANAIALSGDRQQGIDGY
jgi:hypothetical protein